MSRIVQVANFFSPTSGGLKTAMNALATGYAAAGHEVVQVVPGPVDGTEITPWGRRESLAAQAVPGTGYRLMRPSAVKQRLSLLEPDRLEVHDRTTLRGLGTWAQQHGVSSMVISHERLDRLARQWLPVGVDRATDRSNVALVDAFDAVVCTTSWAADELRRIGAPNLHLVPLGVDLDAFHPRHHDASVRLDGEVLLVMASRLSREKRPGVALDAVDALCRKGFRPRLLVAGEGPLHRGLALRARGLPVELLGYVHGRDRLARLLASADAVIAPGPVETFGLAALEALACGTPVIADERSALGEVLGRTGGLVTSGTGADIGTAVARLMTVPEDRRRLDARARAERFPWSRTVDGFLAVHQLTTRVPVAA